MGKDSFLSQQIFPKNDRASHTFPLNAQAVWIAFSGVAGGNGESWIFLRVGGWSGEKKALTIRFQSVYCIGEIFRCGDMW